MNNSTNLNGDRDIFLAQVASLYYDQDKTQQEIAEIMEVSRSAISRFLTEAKQKGIVEITIKYPFRTNPQLETKLVEKFDLKTARVLIRGNKSIQEMVRGLGVLAAEYFLSIVKPDSIIGVSWGTNLYQTINAIRPVSLPKAEVIQLVGGTGLEKGSAIGPLLSPMLAQKINCPCYNLNAPLLTSSPSMRNLLIKEPSIKETMDRARNVDIALVGIGALHYDIYNPYKLGYVSKEEVNQMVSCGVVGDVCVTHFDIDGNIICEKMNERVVGINYKYLREIPYVIGVAGGNLKAEAILGALRANLVNVLVTDETASEKILSLINQQSLQ